MRFIAQKWKPFFLWKEFEGKALFTKDQCNDNDEKGEKTARGVSSMENLNGLKKEEMSIGKVNKKDNAQNKQWLKDTLTNSWNTIVSDFDRPFKRLDKQLCYGVLTL